MYILAAVFLVFSGAAALTYQVAWVRLLGLSMGSTSASISTVLAAFFLGMAVGSFFANRIGQNKFNSFSVYVFLEIAIAVSGLILLPLLLNLDSLISSVPLLSENLLAKFLLTVGLLSIPTICMGATFPIMATILVRKEQEVGLRMGQLYSLNTLGAIFGAIFSGFIFIPNYGLDGAIYIAVLLNLTVAFLAWQLNKRITLPTIDYQKPETVDSAGAKTNAHQISALTILFITGFASIASEIGWTKYLSIFTGTTIYGFSAILGIFLIGIASGSWWIKNRIEKIQQPKLWLAILLLAAGISLIYARWGMTLIPLLYEGLNSMSISGEAKQWIKYCFVFCIIFPPTFFFGAIFPLNLKIYCTNLSGVQEKVGKAYATNTLASIAGALVAGFWLIPTLGTDFLLKAMFVVVLLSPIIIIVKYTKKTTQIGIVCCSLFFLYLGSVAPEINYKTLISSVAYKFDVDAASGKEPDFLFVKEGKVSVVSVVSYDGQYAKVQANGLNESLIDMDDPSNGLIIESLLAYLPYFVHKDPKTAFIVGYGGGVTTRAFTQTTIPNIRVVELEPAVVEAGKSIRNGPVSALDDPRVSVEINDARNTLLTENKKYDIIAAQPSHPWLAGASNVFTQEFFHLVDSRLTDEGIFSQWINLFRMDVTTLRSLFKAFYSVFPEGVTFANLDTGDLMLIGSRHPIKFDFNQIRSRMNPSIMETLAHYNVFKPTDILWYLALSREEVMQVTGDVEPNTDKNIFSEVRLSALLDNPTGDENPYLFLRNNFQFDAVPYLNKKNVNNELLTMGRYFLNWEAPDVTFKIAKQLYKLDQTWGLSLKHEIYFWRHDWAKATQLYNEHDDWLYQVHLNQLEIVLRQKDWQLGLSIVNRIKSIKQRRVGFAMLLYHQNKWDELEKISPLSHDEKIWTLMGVANNNLLRGGKALADILPVNSAKTHQIRKVIQYYAAIQDNTNMNVWSSRLVNANINLVNRYKKLARIALDDNDFAWNLEIIEAIKAINPANQALEALIDARTKKMSSVASTQP